MIGEKKLTINLQELNDEGATYIRLPEANVPFKLIIREAELAATLGLSPSSIRNRYDPQSPSYDAEFPLPRRLSCNGRKSAIGWLYEEIVYWVNTRPRIFNMRQLDTPKKEVKHRQKQVLSKPAWRI